MKKLICIGDSHASFFSGTDVIQPEYPDRSQNGIAFLEGIRLGPVLAYSLHKTGTTNKGREKLYEIVSGLNKNENAIMFCFGEIDCRFHLLRIAEKNNVPVNEIIKDCVNRYFDVVIDIQKRGFEVLVWNVIPSSILNNNPEYPHYGTLVQRNKASVYFNQLLENKCRESGIPFIRLFDKFIRKDLTTKDYYLFDGIHLGQLAMPYFINSIKMKFPHIRIESFNAIEWKIQILKASIRSKKNKIFSIIKRTLRGNR